MADDIRVTFVCGHARSLGSDADKSSVECELCGERRVARVHAPPPRVTAVNCNSAAMGPHVHHA